MTRARRAATKITLRPAVRADALILLRWRNDAETRRQSRSMRKVAAPAHRAWLRRVLDDPEIRLFIAEDASGVPVGTGRLDYRGQGAAELNLTVAPERRGEGIGSRIIAALVRESRQLGWPRQVARIRDGNVRSLRAFRAAGFVSDRCIHLERG